MMNMFPNTDTRLFTGSKLYQICWAIPKDVDGLSWAIGDATKDLCPGRSKQTEKGELNGLSLEPVENHEETDMI